jgi:hypothetical protein
MFIREEPGHPWGKVTGMRAIETEVPVTKSATVLCVDFAGESNATMDAHQAVNPDTVFWIFIGKRHHHHAENTDLVRPCHRRSGRPSQQ